MSDQELPTFETFQSCVGQKFQVDGESDARTLELIEAKLLEQYGTGDTDRRTPFSLLFREAVDDVQPQQVCSLRHDTLGSHDIFLVPVSADNDGVCYEAVFG